MSAIASRPSRTISAARVDELPLHPARSVANARRRVEACRSSIRDRRRTGCGSACAARRRASSRARALVRRTPRPLGSGGSAHAGRSRAAETISSTAGWPTRRLQATAARNRLQNGIGAEKDYRLKEQLPPRRRISPRPADHRRRARKCELTRGDGRQNRAPNEIGRIDERALFVFAPRGDRDPSA